MSKTCEHVRLHRKPAVILYLFYNVLTTSAMAAKIPAVFVQASDFVNPVVTPQRVSTSLAPNISYELYQCFSDRYIRWSVGMGGAWITMAEAVEMRSALERGDHQRYGTLFARKAVGIEGQEYPGACPTRLGVPLTEGKWLYTTVATDDKTNGLGMLYRTEKEIPLPPEPVRCHISVDPVHDLGTYPSSIGTWASVPIPSSVSCTGDATVRVTYTGTDGRESVVFATGLHAGLNVSGHNGSGGATIQILKDTRVDPVLTATVITGAPPPGEYSAPTVITVSYQ